MSCRLSSVYVYIGLCNTGILIIIYVILAVPYNNSSKISKYTRKAHSTSNYEGPYMRDSWGGKGFGGIGTAELLAPNGSPPVPNSWCV